MSFLFANLLRVLILSASIALPGFALAHWLGLRARRKSDAWLAVLAGGIGVVVLAAYLMLFAGLYSRPVLLLVTFLAPAAYLWSIRGRGLSLLSPAGREKRAASPGLTWLDRAVLGMVGIWLLAAWADAATTPLLNWDALVSWDKWAVDWARRTQFWNYPTGDYPQTLPILGSILYKLFGTAQDNFPPEQFAWHGAQALIAGAYVLGLVRLAQLARVPVWAAVTLGLCSGTFHSNMTSGNAECLLMFLFVAPIALLCAHNAGEIEIERGLGLFFGILMFAAAFTKLMGVLVLPLAAYLAMRNGRGWRWRALVTMVALPLLLTTQFLAYQQFVFAIPEEKLSPTGLYYESILKPSRFDAAIRISYAPDGKLTPGVALQRWLRDYSVPKEVAVPVTVTLVVCMLAGFAAAAVRAYLITFLLASVVWYWLAPYDSRNLLPATGYLSVGIAGGGAFLWRRFASRPAARWMMLVAFGLSGIALAGRCVPAIAPHAKLLSGMLPGDSIGKRIAAIEGGTATIIAQYFPSYAALYRSLVSLPLLEPPAKLATNTAMFRWFPDAIYTASHWSVNWMNPGDLYVGAFGLKPRNYDQWTLIHRDDQFAWWINQKDAKELPLGELTLTGASPPKKIEDQPRRLALLAGGDEALIMYNFPARDWREGDSLVWRAVVAGERADPQLTASHSVDDESILSPRLSMEARDVSESQAGRVLYGGLLTFGKPASQLTPTDKVLVGLRRAGAPGRVVIESFRVSLLRRSRP